MKYTPDSISLIKISVLQDEVERLEALNLVAENEEVYMWLKQRIRILKEGR